MIHQSWEFGKATRPLFAEPVTYGKSQVENDRNLSLALKRIQAAI